jgi:hypothetical protein
MKTASNPNRILSIDMSVSSTPPPKRPHSPRLASAAFPRLPCEPRRALCEHDPNAETHDQNKKFLHCVTFQYSARGAVPAPEKYAVNVPQIVSTDCITWSKSSPAARPRRLAFPKAPPSSTARPCRCYSFVRQSVDNRLQRFDMFLRLAFIPQRALARRVNAEWNFRFVINIFVKCARAGTK